MNVTKQQDATLRTTAIGAISTKCALLAALLTGTLLGEW